MEQVGQELKVNVEVLVQGNMSDPYNKVAHLEIKHALWDELSSFKRFGLKTVWWRVRA